MPPTGSPATDALLVYGPLGVFIVLFVLGLVVAKPTIQREQKLTDVALANNEKLASAMDRLTDTVLRDRSG